jgi:hypothetical protein
MTPDARKVRSLQWLGLSLVLSACGTVTPPVVTPLPGGVTIQGRILTFTRGAGEVRLLSQDGTSVLATGLLAADRTFSLLLPGGAGLAGSLGPVSRRVLLGEKGCTSTLLASTDTAQVFAFAGLSAVTPGAVTELSALILNSAADTLSGHAYLFSSAATRVTGTITCKSGVQTWDVALNSGWNTLSLTGSNGAKYDLKVGASSDLSADWFPL